MRVHFSGKAFDYQTLRAMSYAPFGGAEIGEVLVTAERIESGDTESWHDEWRLTAERVERLAEEANREGRERTARGAYFRAHTYYRTAEFFLAADDARRRPTYERSRDAFRSAVERLDAPTTRVEIPYEDTHLPGYLFVPPDADGPRPTVVCLGGFDSVGEELYFLCAVPEALARGYAVLAFEGPGQGAPLRAEGLTARHDWENVVGPVLDYAEGLPSVDGERIGLVGVSFGGYYAPRAAAFDDRVAALVTFDHMHDLYRASEYEAPRLSRAVRRAPDAVVNALASLGARVSLESRWLMENAKWVFGVDSTAELQRTLPRYSLSRLAERSSAADRTSSGSVAGRIDCPTLVLAGEDDHFVPLGLAREFAEELTCPTTVRVFRTEEGAGEHCQIGNLTLASDVIYDWFDETLASR